MNMRKCFFWLICFWTFSIGKAFSIEIPMDLVSWKYNGGSLFCKLENYIPQYGKFYFRSNKKNELLFNIELKKHSENWSKSSLFSHSAPWVNDAEQKLISNDAAITKNKISFSNNSEILLNAIAEGNWLKVAASGSNASGSAEYLIPLIRFQEALSEFKQCAAGLPEMSFAEARDADIYFKSGQSTLSAAQRKYIRALHSYLIADARIDKVLIDGHTDSTGDSVTNLKISRQRAKLVARELRKLGVNEKKIELRAHGSRYPVLTNVTKAGRAKNRRVTVRLVRDNENVMPAIYSK